MSLTRFHVMPHDSRWRVVRIGDLFRGPYRTKREAVDAARLVALFYAPSEVLVHDATGAVEAATHYGA